MSLEVLHEDTHCLAVNKPAGLPSQADESGAATLVDVASRYLKERYRKPGNVYVGLVHRLDRPTSGVVLLARTSKAAGRLAAQFRAGSVEKVYWAIVEGDPGEDEGIWTDRLEKDRRTNRSRTVAEDAEGSKEARVAYRILERWPDSAKLELRPLTGRSHQLRVQLASRGLPIVGDGKYGAGSRITAIDGGGRIALHARRLSFTHPTRGEVIAVEAPVPADWPEPWRSRPGPPYASGKPAAGSSR
jgi:23S rRNA pseudouridine1911/1915/1917 synthase